MTLLQLAMKWCATRPGVTTVITGVSRLEQLEQNVATVDVGLLSQDIFAKCDEVWYDLRIGSRFAYNR